MNNTYIIFYKGNRRKTNFLAYCSDWVIRKFTRGIYSHCEIAIEDKDDYFVCYSSSIRDGGVRTKRMKLTEGHWDMIPVTADKDKIETFFQATDKMKYDFLGCIGIINRNIHHSSSKYFCSEWCAEVIGLEQPESYSPNELYKKLAS